MGAALDDLFDGVCEKNNVTEMYIATLAKGQSSTVRYNLQAVPSGGDVLLVSSVVRSEKRDVCDRLPRVDVVIIVRPRDSTSNKDEAQAEDMSLTQIRVSLTRKIAEDKYGQVNDSDSDSAIDIDSDSVADSGSLN